MLDLEFTGERVVPGKVEPELEIEHRARYHFAAPWVRGRRVLDYGCGTGYGAAILRRAGALRVVGTDRAPDALFYAASRFGDTGLAFCAGDCLRPPLRSGAFDVVVAFEVIEHVDGYRRFLGEVRRVLGPAGILVLSTPNKRTYRDGPDTPSNPFHVHEFHLGELRRALAEFFPAVAVLGQSRTEGAYFYADTGNGTAATDRRLSLIGDDEGVQGAGRLDSADYFLALCAADPDALAAAPAGGSFYIVDDNAVRRRNRRIVELQGELDGRTRWALQLQAELEGGSGRIATVQSRLDAAERRLDEAARTLEAAERRLEATERVAGEAQRAAGERTAEEHERARRLETMLAERIDQARERTEAGLAGLRTAVEELAERERERDAIVGWHRDTLVRQQGELERHRRDLARRREQDEPLAERLAELTRRSEALEAHSHELSRRADRQDAAIAGQAERMGGVERDTARARELIDMLWGARSWRLYTGLRRFFAALVPRRAARGSVPSRRPAEAGSDERPS